MSAGNTNPYVGLRPFRPEDALYFFGRREQTAALLGQLHASRFLAVVGSSGCGKSSLLQAGLIPALEGGFLVEERDRWMMFSMRPGDGPVWALARSLCRPVQGVGSGAEASDADATALAEEVRENWSDAVIEHLRGGVDERTSFLLIVDQFEEIFRFRGPDADDLGVRDLSCTQAERARRRDEANDFVDMFLELSRQSEIPIYVVFSMRSDFLGDCDVFYGLPEAMNRGRFLVPRLTRKQTRQAIEGPASFVGARLEAKLVDRLLNDLGDRTDRLPVLEHALMRTFDLWRSSGSEGEIAESDYLDSGGLRAALSNHAEEALAEVDFALTEKIFKCLTDTDPLGRRVRRPCLVAEIAETCEAESEEVLEIVERFNADRRNFLWVGGEASGEMRVDISHESLIRVWQRLWNWAQEEADSAETYRRLADTARRFAGEGAYLPDPDLSADLAWRESQRPTAAWARRYDPDYDLALRFLEDSRLHRDAQKQAEARSRRNRRWSVFVTLVVVLTAVGLFAYEKAEQLATEQARSARQDALFKAEHDVLEARRLARTGSHEEAVEVLREASKVLGRYREPARQTRAMREQAVNLSLLERNDEAANLLADARRIAEAEQDVQELGRVIEAIAMLKDRGGAREPARAVYGESLHQFSKSRDQRARGRVLERLAVYERSEGDHDRAAALFEDSKRAYKLAGDTLGIRRVESQLAEVLPWAYITDLRDLSRTAIRGFDGRFILTGRGRSNHINSREFTNYVSRWHIVIERMEEAGVQTIADMRSTNGSALNGRPLRYAHPERIVDGDVFTLAYEAAFLFTTSRRSFEPLTEGTWGLLISPTGFHHLAESRYSLAVEADGVRPMPEPGEEGPSISWDGRCAWVHNPEGDRAMVHWLMDTKLQREYAPYSAVWGTFAARGRITTIHEIVDDELNPYPRAWFQLIPFDRAASGCASPGPTPGAGEPGSAELDPGVRAGGA